MAEEQSSPIDLSTVTSRLNASELDVALSTISPSPRVDASARALASDWMTPRLTRVAEAAVDSARAHGLSIQRIDVTGMTFADDGDSQVTLHIVIDADDDTGYRYWEQLAGLAQSIASTPPHPHGPQAGVRLEVAVAWDVGAVRS